MSESVDSTPSGSSRPGSSPRPGGEQRRQQILREAMRCFADKGFRGTTTRDVAARVGITEAALYRYFESKQALYQAIIDAKMQAADPIERVQAAARRGDDRAVFLGLAKAMMESVDTDPSFLRILLYTGLEGHELAEPFFETRIRRLREFMAGYIERRIREGAFREIDPRLGALALLGMLVDYLMAREVFQQREVYPTDVAAVAEVFVSILLDGIRRPEVEHD